MNKIYNSIIPVVIGILLISSCKNEKVYFSAFIWPNNQDTIQALYEGPFRRDKIDKHLEVSLDEYLYNSKDLYIVSLINQTNTSLTILRTADKQIYLDSALIFTRPNHTANSRMWFLEYNRPHVERKQHMTLDTLVRGKIYEYWYQSKPLENGDSVVLFKTFISEERKYPIILTGIIKNDKVRLYNN